MDNALRLIGIAKKAGRLEVGEEPVGAAARARQAKLLILAADAADNTLRRCAHFAEAGAVRLVRSPYAKAELGMAVGRSSCAMLALTDAGLAASFLGKLAAADPERYGEDAQALSRKAEQVLQRQREQRRHEKNLLRAKAKPWAAPQKSGAERRLAEKTGGGKAREERKAAPAPPRGAGGFPGAGGPRGPAKGRPPRKTGGKTGNPGRKSAPFDSKQRRGPGTGTGRKGGRQVT